MFSLFAWLFFVIIKNVHPLLMEGRDRSERIGFCQSLCIYAPPPGTCAPHTPKWQAFLLGIPVIRVCMWTTFSSTSNFSTSKFLQFSVDFGNENRPSQVVELKIEFWKHSYSQTNKVNSAHKIDFSFIWCTGRVLCIRVKQAFKGVV